MSRLIRTASSMFIDFSFSVTVSVSSNGKVGLASVGPSMFIPSSQAGNLFVSTYGHSDFLSFFSHIEMQRSPANLDCLFILCQLNSIMGYRYLLCVIFQAMPSVSISSQLPCLRMVYRNGMCQSRTTLDLYVLCHSTL